MLIATQTKQALEVAPAPQAEVIAVRKSNIAICGELPVFTHITESHQPERAALEAFIQEMFHKVHGANITHFMPKLLSLRDSENTLRAVCGLRHAQDESLFLEHYLDAPIEEVLSQQVGQTIHRDEILEIGNLAVLEPACIRSLLASVSVYLHGTDTKWAVFTGITTLRNALKRLHMPVHMLGEAKLSRLPMTEQSHWGTYYDQQPQIMAIARFN
jgi:transcriptional regulator of met regulon